MKLIVAGDLVPTPINFELFRTNQIQNLLGEELSKKWFEADFRVVNLETPLTDSNQKIKKNGPCLKAPIDTVKGITGLQPSIVSLANNHIMDYSDEGLNDTLNALNMNSIDYIGVGSNLSNITAFKIINFKSQKIGVYSCTESEFSIATGLKSGANPFDPFETLDQIQKLKENVDILIVLYHGGKEQYRYPTPYQQKVARKIVEKGADIVVFQHSHCVGCMEKYLGSKIIYGQGNFLFKKNDNEYWNNGLLLELDFLEESVEINFIPITSTDLGIQLADDTTKQQIMSGFFKRSDSITTEGFIEESFTNLVNKMEYNYSSKILGWNKWASRIDRKILKQQLLNLKLDDTKVLTIINLIKCETHREILISVLENRLMKNNERKNAKRKNMQ